MTKLMRRESLARLAAVDVWHCEAGGVYSGASANSTGANFLRGAIFRNGGRYGMLAPKKTAAGYTGTITMGVHV